MLAVPLNDSAANGALASTCQSLIRFHNTASQLLFWTQRAAPYTCGVNDICSRTAAQVLGGAFALWFTDAA